MFYLVRVIQNVVKTTTYIITCACLYLLITLLADHCCIDRLPLELANICRAERDWFHRGALAMLRQ